MPSNAHLETIGAAAAGIAHDINNQLTLILNHLEFSDIEAARAAASRCAVLTGTILSFSRGDGLNIETIDIARFIQEFIEGLRLPLDKRVILDAPSPTPLLRADPVAVYRVLSNLVANAFAAMSGGGVVRIRPFADGTIEVDDSGCGIPPENVAKIFEPFFTTKPSRGTGLGLAIVRDIMRQHGGSVTVESQPGRGSRFRLQFGRKPY